MIKKTRKFTWGETCGFTLLELAITLIIIGLLTAGFTAGKELVAQGKIKLTIEQLTDMQNNIRTFRLTYDSLPGDMKNATNYWTETLDGNGDLKLDDTSEANSLWYEHLDLASLSGSLKTDSTGRPLIPLIKWGIEYIYDDQWAQYPPRNLLRLYDYENSGSIEMSAENAIQIDEKMDDGKPYTGNIHATTDDENCDATGLSSSILCCVDNFSMNNASFDISNLTLQKADYQYGSNRCTYLFVDVDT